MCDNGPDLIKGALLTHYITQSHETCGFLARNSQKFRLAI